MRTADLRRTILAGLAAALCALGAARPARAISTLNFAATADADGYAVCVNGNRLLTLRASPSSAQAAAIAQRLQAIAERGGAKQVEIVEEQGAPALALDGEILVRVDARMAAGNNSTPKGLAETWTQRLTEIFAQPFITVEKNSIAVPLGESRSLPLLGNLAAGVVVTADPKVVRGNYDATEGALRLTGVGRGQIQAVVTCGLASLPLQVRVAPWAGTMAPRVEARVTGRSVPRELLAKAAAFAAYDGLSAQPGATVSVGSPTLVPESNGGQDPTATIPVSITGEEYLPVTGSVTATIRNTPFALPQPGVLLVSNRPERLTGPGLWYECKIPVSAPARILYHHVNASGSAADLVVELANPAAFPVSVHIVEGVAGPSRDEIFVGHIAARTFLSRMASQVGYLMTLPPHTRAILASHRLPPKAIASGILAVGIVQGSDVVARVRLLPPASRPLISDLEGVSQSLAQPFWVFPNPRKTLTADYVVGGNWAFVSVGRHAVPGVNHGEELAGNYGILYDITFNIHNPTDRIAHLELAFQTAAGAARGVVLINGVVYQTGLVRSNRERTLMRFSVPAHTKRTLRMQTMPQSGSNYPVRLLCRPAGSGD